MLWLLILYCKIPEGEKPGLHYMLPRGGRGNRDTVPFNPSAFTWIRYSMTISSPTTPPSHTPRSRPVCDSCLRSGVSSCSSALSSLESAGSRESADSAHHHQHHQALPAHHYVRMTGGKTRSTTPLSSSKPYQTLEVGPEGKSTSIYRNRCKKYSLTSDNVHCTI